MIQPINASPDDVVRTLVTPQAKGNSIKHLSRDSGLLLSAPAQPDLFHVEKQAEFNGIEMGVLESGVPFLSGRGLARMCGIDPTGLREFSDNWPSERLKPRGRQINELLAQAGYTEDYLYLKSEHKGTPINAYTEDVCLALLEYYAFIAKDQREQAQTAFRALAKVKFREFIYNAVGYSPQQKVLDSWKHFHDRVDITMDAAPDGYFGVFREIAVMIVPMIRSGVIISDRVVPDISVGKAWSAFWEDNGLAAKFGDRTRYDHEYPLYYPQAKSNPQPSFAYPNSALGAFREWLQKNYITSKFPAYLIGQTKKGTLPMITANKALQAFGVPQIEHKAQKTIK